MNHTFTNGHQSYLGVPEIASRMGLDPRTIRTHIHDSTDPLPAYRVGGKLLFDWGEVNAWVQRRKVKPADASGVAAEILSQLKECK